MRAEVTEKLSGGFFLSEQSIKKIIDLISSRVGEDLALTLTVIRADNAKISYGGISELIQKEENSPTEKILTLEIESQGSVTQLKLTFERGEETSLRIESEDRDVALLLAADLRQYIRNEVLVSRLEVANRILSHKLFFPLFMMISLLVMVTAAEYFTNSPKISLSSATLEQKIDYLVEAREGARVTQSFPLYFIVGLFLLLVLTLGFFSSRFLPLYTFHWGPEIEAYGRAQRLRSNIFWIVGIGLLVGVVAGSLSGRISAFFA